MCYLIGLSHVDPIAARLFLGRFLSEELASVPDIDLDFPRDVREGLMLAVVERYGPEHAALVAAFPTYRVRGAIRDLGKALALPQGEVERMARLADEWGAIGQEQVEQMRERAGSPRWRAFAFLMEEIMGIPRHISQHSGGMVISTRPLVELVPVIPAAMEGRQICQWDKDSCADAGFLKIDLLGLGMLSAVEECVDLIAAVARARRSTSPGSGSTTPRCTPRSSRPTRWACSRSRAGRRCSRCTRRCPRTWTTSRCRWRWCGRGRSSATRSTPTSSTAAPAAPIPASCPPTTTRCSSRCCATPWAWSCSRIRCSRWRSRSPGSRPARPRACAGR